MITRFVEVTDGVGYGKFLVCRMDAVDLMTETAMPDAPPGQRLLTYSGRRRFNDHSTLVIDLQLGTAAAWPLEGVMEAYEAEHLNGRVQFCWMYRPFVKWLYEQGTWAMGAGSIETIPRYLDLRLDSVVASALARSALVAGKRLRIVVGTGAEDPTLEVWLSDGMVMSAAVAGWSAGVVEPVCAFDSPFLDEYVTDRESVTVIEPSGYA